MARVERGEQAAEWLMLLGAALVPVSLLWDYAFESTIGVDLFWSAPHVANDLAIALAAGGALAAAVLSTRGHGAGVALGRVRAPLGAWLVLWGAFAFVTALFFDRWWQAGYGLAAGIWHPPQLLKALAYFAVTIGVWLCTAGRQQTTAGAFAFAAAGGVVLAMISVVTLPFSFANRQHSALFYQLGCATYPIALLALARAGRLRFAASLGACAAMLLVAAMVWILPLVPGSPQVGPIYNPRDHLLPPPFPLLLIVPALAIDALLRVFPARAPRAQNWAHALESGLLFFVIFTATQWVFSAFLLSPAADHWLFAGGGRHWPFFLRIDPSARTAFWLTPEDELTLARMAIAAAFGVLAARAGLWLGSALQRERA